MITRIALDSQALRPAAGSVLEQRLQSQRLAGIVRDYGLLSLLGEHDASELQIVLEGLAESLGYDFWRPLLRALADGGQGVFCASPTCDLSTHELCESGKLDGLRPVADLVVVDGDGEPMPGLTPAQSASLYESQGFADAGGNLELALAGAVDQCQAVRSVRKLRDETIIQKGTRDSDLWATYFSSLARASSEVNMFDRYLFSGLIKKDSRQPDTRYLQWFLNALDRDLPARATINLFAWTGEKVATTNWDKSAQPYTIDDIASALGKLERWNRPARLNVYLWDGLHHDRHIRFGSGHALMPHQGFDQLRFPQGRLATNFSYSFVPTGLSLAARADEEAKARANGSQWVLRSKKGGFDAVAP